MFVPEHKEEAPTIAAGVGLTVTVNRAEHPVGIT
jgi:hypothetical protein